MAKNYSEPRDKLAGQPDAERQAEEAQTRLTDEAVQALADEAERGYPVHVCLRCGTARLETQMAPIGKIGWACDQPLGISCAMQLTDRRYGE